MAHSLETNVPFLIADCEATGTSVENMHVNDVILGGFINAYSCRIGLLEFFIVFKTKNNKKFPGANVTAIRVCCKLIHLLFAFIFISKVYPMDM